MKKWVLLSVILTFLLAQCSAPAKTTDVEGAASIGQDTSSAMRIGLILPSALNDYAFSQSMYRSLTKLVDDRTTDLSINLNVVENRFVVSDALSLMREMAAEGYDLIIAHGAQYEDSVSRIALEYPHISFVWGTSLNTFSAEGIQNVFAYDVRANEAGFVNGVIAGKLTKKKIVGVVGPIEAGEAKQYVDGFLAGVKHVDPRIQVNVIYINSFSDTAAAAQAAQELIDNGADVLTGISQMSIGCIEAVKDNDILWLSAQSDQSPLAPENTVSAVVYDWGVVLDDIIEAKLDGNLGGMNYVISFANEGLKLVFNQSYNVPTDVRDAALNTIGGMLDGSLKIP